MSLLEDRYRHVLRLLPASYRAEREEEMVCAFLEGSGGLLDEDNPRPRWSEIASVAALSVRVRLGGVGAPPRSLAWGEAVRLAAVLGLSFHAMMACVYLGNALELYRIFGAGAPAILGAAGSPERLWNIVQSLGDLLWVAAFASLVLGRTRAAKAAALLALALRCAVLLPVDGIVLDERVTYALTYSLPHVLPVLALLAGFHRDAPPTRLPRWTAVLPPVVGVPLYVLLGMLISALGKSHTAGGQIWSWVWAWPDEPGLACLALLIASVICARAHLRAPAGRTAALPLALVILIVPVTLTRAYYLIVDLARQAPDPIIDGMKAAIAVQLAALLLCGMTLAVLGVRALPAAPRPVPSP